MTDPQLARLEQAVNAIRVDVAEVKTEVKESRSDITEVRKQTTLTNGRVTDLETEVKVARALKEATATDLAKKAVRFSWITPMVAGIGATIGATLLSHFLG